MSTPTAAQLRARAAADLAEAERLDGARQYTETEVKTMTPQQIETARVAGQLDDLLNGKDETA
jgi:hypothetical protein